jgi:hypothetical protein
MVVLEKVKSSAVTADVDDGAGDAAAIEAARVGAEACANSPVEAEPKVGSRQMMCPTEVVGFMIPAEWEPEVVWLRRVCWHEAGSAWDRDQYCRKVPRCSAGEGTGAFDLYDAEPCRRCGGTGVDREEGAPHCKLEAAPGK